MSYFNTRFQGAQVAGPTTMQLQQFADNRKELDQKRTRDAVEMAKEQSRLESLAVGFGLKPGEAKSMSSLELDRFVNVNMQYQVKQKEIADQQLAIGKFLQDQAKIKSDINFRNQELMLDKERLANSRVNTLINSRNAQINETNTFLERAEKNRQLKQERAFRDSIINAPEEFKKENPMVVRLAEKGGSVSDMKDLMGGDMSTYQKEVLSRQDEKRQKEEDQLTVEGSITLPMSNAEGKVINSPNIKYSGKLPGKSELKEFKKEVIATQRALDTLTDLINLGDKIREKYGTGIGGVASRAIAQINPNDKEFRQMKRNAETLARQMIGQTRIQLLGPGVLSNYDISIIESIFANPGDIVQLYDRVEELRNVRRNMLRSISTSLRVNGLNPTDAIEGSSDSAEKNPGQGNSPTNEIKTGTGQTFYQTQGGGLQVTSP